MTVSLLASGGLLEGLGINLTVFATQVVIFSITFLLLSRILFGRVLGFMKTREEELQKSSEAIVHDRQELVRLTKEYEAHIAKVEKEAYEKTQAMLKEALAKATEMVAGAQADSKAEVGRAVAGIEKEKRESLSQLRAEVTRLTIGVAEKVMETKLDPAAAGGLVQKFVAERS
jgi:F-type H+-transporting ATPase subunit b